MQVIRHLQDGHAPKGTVLVLGNFACVHRGHRALLSDAKRIAVERQAPLAVMVFEPHPQEFFRPESEPLRVTSFHKRASE